MKRFLKLLCSLLVFCTMAVHAQTEKVEFSYSHDSLTELLKDTIWLKACAEKYLQSVKNGLLPPSIDDEIYACVASNENVEGLKILSKELMNLENSEKEYSFEKVMYPIWYSYFYYTLHPEKNSYYDAVKQTFEKLKPSLDDLKNMYIQQAWPDTSEKALSSLISSVNHTNEFIVGQVSQFVPGLKNLNRPKKVLTPEEISLMLFFLSERKIALAIKDEQIKYASEQLPLVNSLQEKYDLQWESRLYHFSSTDHPQTIVAANFQVFDKDDFPASQIWVNKKEIPNNSIDDDKNGFIDDVNGVIYLKNKKLASSGIPLIRENAEDYYDSLKDRTVGFGHGTMTVELMLKDNPYVKIMGLEHNQKDLVWKEIHQLFTKDVEHNRRLIDSLIELRLEIWKNLVLYCKQNNVRVAEINSIGLLLHGDEFVLTGCGKDSIETELYTAKKFWELVHGYDKIFKLSPNTLFVIAGGNKGVDNISNIQLESSIHTPNTLIVGALGKDLKRKEYSSYGKDVEIYAPAHFDLVNHKDSYSESRGTSAASPVVCNLAIKLFCLNPKLSPVQVKKLIIESSDKDLLEEGINVINPKKAVALMRKIIK